MIGRTIAHYRILEHIGEGGMGVVYKAEDMRLGRTVALKFLPPHLTRDDAARERFMQEARAAAALNHPDIVTVYDIDQADEGLYIAMECVEGESLQARIERSVEETGGGLPLEEVERIARGICEGLGKAHEAGIIHRDIKPGNLLIDTDGRVKILDFGLAKLRGVSDLTGGKTTLGTARYMSPEQTRGDPVDCRTDLWAVGAVLYEMLTGRPPFRGDYEQAVVYSILNEDPAPVSTLREDVPPALASAVARALSKDPADRFASAEDLLAALSTPGGAAPRARGPRRVLALPLRPVLYGGAAVAVAALVLLAVRPGLFPGRRGKYDSLAVLPLRNLSGDPEQEYLADGMTDAIITELSRIRALRVISRNSAMRYKDTKKTLLEIARDLRVDVIVEGSAVRAGDRIAVTAQLIEAANDRNLWAERYEADLQDILKLEKDVARSIAAEIRIAMTPEELARLASAGPVDPAVHEAYLKGVFHRNKMTYEGIRKSIEYFQQAVDLDPSYAPGYTGLALAYDDLACLGALSPGEAWPKAQAAADRAVELDPDNAEAHAILADVKFLYDWDWKGAEREFQRAIDLNPGHITAHGWYAMYLSALGRHSEAIQEIHRAVDIDPLSIGMRQNEIVVLRYAGRREEAEKRARELLEMDPSLPIPHVTLGSLYTDEGRYEEAVREFETARKTVGPQVTVPLLVRALALSGQTARADSLLGLVLPSRPEEDAQALPHLMAMAYAALGRPDSAMVWLETAYARRVSHLAFLLVDPAYKDLYGDPRFQAFVRRLGLTR